MQTENPKENKNQLLKIWSHSWALLERHLGVLAPFVILAVLDFIALGVLYFFPRKPVSLILVPIIKTYWGERFLHYPLNFFLLPKLLYYARTVLSVVMGSLVAGMVILRYASARSKNTLTFLGSLKAAVRRYPALFFAQLFLQVIYIGIYRVFESGIVRYFVKGHQKLLGLDYLAWHGPILIIVSTFLGALIQALFVYSLPSILLDKRSLWGGLGRGFVLCRKLFWRTFFLILVPSLLYLPIVVLNYNLGVVINKFAPEATLVLLSAGIVLGTLIVDPIITVVSTEAFCQEKEA
jgi:hypothetical protein